MQTCTQCGAQSPREAKWCTSCYLLFLPPVSPPPVPDALPAAVSAWPHAAPQPLTDVGTDGRLLSHRALTLVSASIGFGGLMQLAAYLLSRDDSISQDTLIRTDLVLTVVVYAVVGVLMVSQITPKVRLRWGDGSLAARIANGGVLGLGLGGGILGLSSLVAGHVNPDPRILLLMDEGDPTHVVVMTLLTVAIAPLVEEILFRGLLLESLRGRGTRTAVFGSAVFFAVWHFIPAAIVYYTLLGAALGGLYLKRGLASSMAAHACFNGVITVAAIVVAVGPGTSYDVGGLALTAPSAWSEDHAGEALPDSLVLDGPDAQVSLNLIFGGEQPFDPDEAAQRMRTSPDLVSDGATLDPNTIREVQLPTAGEAVEADVSVAGAPGELYLFSVGGQDYVLAYVNGGGAGNDRDFAKMLASLRQE
ncbi:MAG TPA: CPBP family intramembrane glutamic endopeptidase [Mycobacteriales bacterium]|nr:CPBP family intramembrane glutamic endopeptidase [Mycobacteriales bacterium]